MGDLNTKCIVHSVFTSQTHDPTEDAFKPAILRSSGVGRQKCVVVLDDAKTHTEREREERQPGPGTGAGPMEVGGGAAAVVESKSALHDGLPDGLSADEQEASSCAPAAARATAHLLPRERLCSGGHASSSAPVARRARVRRRWRTRGRWCERPRWSSARRAVRMAGGRAGGPQGAGGAHGVRWRRTAAMEVRAPPGSAPFPTRLRHAATGAL